MHRSAKRPAVYPLRAQKSIVLYAKNAARARREGLDNLTAVTGAPDAARLPRKVDLVLMVDTYHHIARREDYFRRLAQSLKPGGRIAIIDFNGQSAMGPPPGERIAAARAVTEMAAAGYRLVGEHDFLPHQYFLVFRPDRGG